MKQIVFFCGWLAVAAALRAGEVQDAIDAAPTGTAAQPTTIHVSPGVHRELIYIQREKRFLHLVGESGTNTVLSYDLYASLAGRDGKPIGTFRTASVMIDADDFTAENITFENTAGPKGQALAVRVDGDRDTFRNCRFLGWQDTILDNRGRHYYTNCYIQGAVDFIFGGGTAYFDGCRIQCEGSGYITAASTPRDQPFGFVFTNCVIGGAPKVRTYLGRPWRAYGSVTFLDCVMSDVVRPKGWDNWRDPSREKTARFSEYQSAGPGARPEARCSWSKQLTEEQAKNYSRENVLEQGQWPGRDN